MKRRALWTATALVAWAVMAWSWLWPPKPRVAVVHDEDGQHVSLDCPAGWVGYAEWHTASDDDPEQRMEQYLKDAKKGVCKRAWWPK